ncbi:MAG: hypothetical protein PVJ68_16365 [Candidatus Thiodiazotropha sp.]
MRGSRTQNHSDRPSRRMHRQARVAPPSLAQVTPLASRGKRRAGLARWWPRVHCLRSESVQHQLRSCCGLCFASQQQAQAGWAVTGKVSA